MDLLESEKPDRVEKIERVDDHSLVLTEPVPAGQDVVIKREEDGQSLVQTIVMVIGAIILVFLLVIFARWVYHKVHNNNATENTGTLQLPQESSNSSNQSTNSQPSSSSSTGTNSGSSSTSSGATNSKALANTGPGNVAAVFAGSTLAAAGLHYIISLRRFSKSSDWQN